MQVIAQKLEDILATLQPLAVDWKDETAHRVIHKLRAIPVKDAYTAADLQELIAGCFTPEDTVRSAGRRGSQM